MVCGVQYGLIPIYVKQGGCNQDITYFFIIHILVPNYKIVKYRLATFLIISLIFGRGDLLVAQNSDLQKKVKEINKSLRADSPYKGKIELNEQGDLVHYQEVYVGTRRVNLNGIDKIEYAYDGYDTNQAPHSVLLKCTQGNCVSVKWVDNQEMDYSYLLFAFREKEDAEEMVLVFEEVRRLVTELTK